jgi:nucleotide-binding universal stress UspA family protein
MRFWIAPTNGVRTSSFSDRTAERAWDRFLLGSVSESVLRHARCSVQVIREPSSS